MTAIDQPEAMLCLVEQLSAIGVVLSCLELLRFPSPLRDDGLMSWSISRLRSRVYLLPVVERFLNCVFSYPGTLAATAIRLGAAVPIAAGVADGSVAVAVTVHAETGAAAGGLIR